MTDFGRPLFGQVKDNSLNLKEPLESGSFGAAEPDFGFLGRDPDGFRS